MTRLTCNYTIAPYSDLEGVVCERTAIRSVIVADGKKTHMFYCSLHWQSVEELPIIKDGIIEDLVEEAC